jgi:mutator protein MutT
MSPLSTSASNKATPLCVVAAVIVDHEGRVLLARRGERMAHAGKWEFPGGKVEDGESFSRALRREIKEELSMDLDVFPALFSEEIEVEGRWIHIHFLRAKICTGESPRLSEHSEICWESPLSLHSKDLAPGDVGFADWLPKNPEALL